MRELSDEQMSELMFAVHFAVRLPSLIHTRRLVKAINYQRGKKLYPNGDDRYVQVTDDAIELRYIKDDRLWFAVSWETLQAAATYVPPKMFEVVALTELNADSLYSPEVRELADALILTGRVAEISENQLYGEAVVREILSKTFVGPDRESNIDPSPRRLLLSMINLRSGFVDFLPGGSPTKGLERLRQIGLPIEFDGQILVNADNSGATLTDVSGVPATLISWIELRSLLMSVTTPAERQAYIESFGPEFTWTGNPHQTAEEWIDRIMDLPHEREWIPPFG